MLELLSLKRNQKGGLRNKMVTYNAHKKANAMRLAALKRRRGLTATVFKKKKGYGISVTRKK